MLACMPFAIDRPAASSAPELIRKPVESCVNVFCRLACVADKECSALNAERLLRIVIATMLAPFEMGLRLSAPNALRLSVPIDAVPIHRYRCVELIQYSRGCDYFR